MASVSLSLCRNPEGGARRAGKVVLPSTVQPVSTVACWTVIVFINIIVIIINSAWMPTRISKGAAL